MAIAEYSNAKPFDKSSLVDWCYRRLGFPVININVDQQQAFDRVDECFDLYFDEHMDGTEQAHIQIVVSAQDVINGYLPTPIEMISIVGIIGFASADQVAAHSTNVINPVTSNVNNLFNLTSAFQSSGFAGPSYQASTNGLDGISSGRDTMPLTSSFISYNYLEMFNDLFGHSQTDTPIRYNANSNWKQGKNFENN